MAKTTTFYKIIQPQSTSVDILDSQNVTGVGGTYGSSTWYYRIVQGAPSRISRYREYDLMDSDVHVNVALDIIAEEMCGNKGKSDDILNLVLTPVGNNLIQPGIAVTLKAALRTWIKLNKWDEKIFEICRNTIKYGDSFFLRPKKPNEQYVWVHPKSVVSAIVSATDVTDIKGWHINEASRFANISVSTGMNFNMNSSIGDMSVVPVDKMDMIRFSINSELSEDAPFGKSVLKEAYRTFKQKELLEDSLIIYRVQRAPERRVFYINTGSMPYHKVAHHLEQIKNEFRQRKVPNERNSSVDSIYNPATMNEDFFFSENAEGKGSRVEVLPAGQNLGELQDLDYFFNKIWMGMRIPQSYLTGHNEGTGMSNDGRVGIAYLQEVKFSLYVERLQGHIERILDSEFKRWLNENNIVINPSLYHLELPAPSNFAKWRQQQMDTELLSTLSMATDTDFISKRFALMEFAQWSQEKVLTNERMLREEKGLDPMKGSLRDLPILYFPEEAEAGGFDGGLGGMGGRGGGGLPPAGEGNEGLENADLEGLDNLENQEEENLESELANNQNNKQSNTNNQNNNQNNKPPNQNNR